MAFDWSLATIAPNREFHVSEILSSLELEHRVFRVVSRISHNGQFVEIVKPVFPGYIFVKPPNREIVLEVIGVVGFVMFGDAVIDLDDIVEQLDAESDGTCILPWSDREDLEDSSFQCGDTVRITDGPTKGRVAVFSRHLSRDKAIVLMEYMGRQVPFTVSHDELEIVASQKWRKRQRRRSRIFKTYRQAA